MAELLTNQSLLLTLCGLQAVIIAFLIFWKHPKNTSQNSNQAVPIQNLVDTLPVGIVIYDRNNRMVICNRMFRQIFDYTEDEAKPGVSSVQLGKIDLEKGVQVPEEREPNRYIGRSDNLKIGEQHTEEIHLSDGRIIRSIEQRLINGNLVRIQIDITALRSAKADLQRSEERLVNAIESLDEGFIYYDADDRLVLANSKYREFYPAQKDVKPGVLFEDAIRLSIDGGEVPAAIGREDEWMTQRLQQHNRNLPVSSQLLQDGRWVQVSERPTPDGGHVGIRTDITRLKQSLEMAESANLAKTAFLGHMSHELRTPLNAIIGFSEILQSKLFGDIGHPKYEEYSQLINKSGHHLLELINDLLDVSRIESENITANRNAFSVQNSIEECIQLLEPTAGKVPLTFMNRLETKADDALIFADPRHFKQIMINLISNALRYTLEGGVQVILENAEQNVCSPDFQIKIIDTGIGIPDSAKARIFEPFARVQNAFVKQMEGAGLGLYLVKRMIEANDGTIDLESQEGVGTTVTLRFKSYSEQTDTNQKLKALEQSPGPTQNV